jgi:hypothetical protein
MQVTLGHLDREPLAVRQPRQHVTRCAQRSRSAPASS